MSIAVENQVTNILYCYRPLKKKLDITLLEPKKHKVTVLIDDLSLSNDPAEDKWNLYTMRGMA